MGSSWRSDPFEGSYDLGLTEGRRFDRIDGGWTWRSPRIGRLHRRMRDAKSMRRLSALFWIRVKLGIACMAACFCVAVFVFGTTVEGVLCDVLFVTVVFAALISIQCAQCGKRLLGLVLNAKVSDPSIVTMFRFGCCYPCIKESDCDAS